MSNILALGLHQALQGLFWFRSLLLILRRLIELSWLLQRMRVLNPTHVTRGGPTRIISHVERLTSPGLRPNNTICLMVLVGGANTRRCRYTCLSAEIPSLVAWSPIYLCVSLQLSAHPLLFTLFFKLISLLLKLLLVGFLIDLSL